MNVKLTWVFKEVEIEYNTEFMAAQFDMDTKEKLVTYRCFDEQCGFEDDLHKGVAAKPIQTDPNADTEAETESALLPT